MELKNWLIINADNIVENICLWDGDNATWHLPDGCQAILCSEVKAKIWQLNKVKNDFELVVVIGASQIGFLFDGEYTITNEPKPKVTE